MDYFYPSGWSLSTLHQACGLLYAPARIRRTQANVCHGQYVRPQPGSESYLYKSRCVLCFFDAERCRASS